MSEAVTESAIETPAPVVETPAAPVALGEVESLADYRARRAAGESGEPVEAPKVEPPAPVEPDPASEAGKELAAKKKSLQARIDELTREKNQSVAAERAKVAALEARLAALEGKQAPAAPAAPAADPNDPEPSADAFDTYEKYVKAQARWEARQELKAHQAAQAQAAQAQHYSSRQEEVRAKAIEAHPDVDAVLQGFVDAGHVFHPAVSMAILHEPLGHEIAYAVAKDPALNVKIAQAPNPWVEIGRLVAKLEAAATPAEPKAPPVSKAPAPIAPVVGESGAGGFDPAKSNSIAEFRKNRERFMRAS